MCGTDPVTLAIGALKVGTAISSWQADRQQGELWALLWAAKQAVELTDGAGVRFTFVTDSAFVLRG